MSRLTARATMNPVDPQPWLSDELARPADHPHQPGRRAAALTLEGGKIHYHGGDVNSV
ncbi:hypothetical protein J5287_21400 [Rhizobium sp. K1/93]|nr:hypothetical protein [Rhizobium sp. L58/93]QXZ87139.1 hypothetical protein J5287_21400 [Rhizobium sp. K1/93]QXZ92827.1 hypothetical protein J5280_19495 [Rhizobium sp. K15/93]QYA03950.1 hypothetical protein J5278_24560 [Rhizobium sp. B21/90]